MTATVEYVEPAAETAQRRQIMTRCPYVHQELRIIWHRAHRDFALRRARPELSVFPYADSAAKRQADAYHRGWNDALTHRDQTDAAFASVVDYENARTDLRSCGQCRATGRLCRCEHRRR